jgi:hypothetical protein
MFPNATYVSLDHAAVRLGVPERWLRDEAEAARIPTLKVGRRTLCELDAVRAALAARAKRSMKKGRALAGI